MSLRVTALMAFFGEFTLGNESLVFGLEVSFEVSRPVYSGGLRAWA
jgi:hypothetical protein